MLDLASNHVPQLQAKYRETLFDDHYKFYSRTPGIDYYLPIAEDCSSGVQFVSIDPSGKVIGYLSVCFNRLTRTAYDMEAIKFCPEKKSVFSKDMGDFDIKLFTEFGMDRLVWSVIVGNPAEKFYDQLTQTCGARVVGTFKNEVMLKDGKLYDLKYYEVLKDEFFKAINENGFTVNNYRGGDN